MKEQPEKGKGKKKNFPLLSLAWVFLIKPALNVAQLA